MRQLSPFEEIKPNLDLKKIIIGGVVVIMKLPFFFLFLFLTILYSLLTSFIPIPLVKHFISKIYSSVLIRPLLFLTGVFHVPIQGTPLIDNYTDTEELNNPQRGDLIISNCSSYLNVLWLQEKYSPIFAVPSSDGNVSTYNFLQLLANILARRQLVSTKTQPLSQLLDEAKKSYMCPVVIFPEGAITNGTSIIKFQSFGSDVDLSTTQVHIYGFLHSGRIVNANFVNGNFVLHLFSMLASVICEMKVRAALPQDIPLSDRIDDDFLQKTRKVLSTITRLPLVDIDYTASENNKKKTTKKHSE